jgi:hypothetical protein
VNPVKRLTIAVPALVAVFVLSAADADRKAAPARPKPADNSRCFVCHGNYEEEAFAVQHAKAGIGCERCHGASDAHCGDENNVTPPEIMYPREKLPASCKECHDAQKLLAMEKHKPVVADLKSGAAICTDCHGKHRIEKRTVRWDKTTRQLLSGG